MKKILSVILSIVLCIAVAVAFAADGAGVRSQSITLYSAAVGTTAVTNGSSFTFDYPMNHLGCDIVSTTSATIAIDGNQGASTTLFSMASRLVGTFVVSAGTISTVVKTTTPFKTIRPVLQSGTSGSVISIYCNALQ